MPGTYLTDLAWVLRSAGLTVIEEPGWQSRGRSSGGFAPGRPTHILEHHTASPSSSDGQRDVNYICYGSPDAPICNVYFNRAGTVWVCAAGATNTNGKGVDTWGGGVPNDKMNEFAIGFEIANSGVGEPYPQAQQDAVMVATIAACAHYRIPSEFVRGHFEWAPTRKIDPTGPSRWAPNGGKWNMTAFRTEVRLGIIGPPQPPEDDDMPLIAYIAKPPASAGGNAPWLAVIDGDVRYATNVDATRITDHQVLNSEQYDWLLKSAGLK